MEDFLKDDGSIGALILLVLGFVLVLGLFTLWQAWQTYRRPSTGRVVGLGLLLGLHAGLGWAWSQLPMLVPFNPFWNLLLPVGLVVGELLLARRARRVVACLVWVVLAVQAMNALLFTILLLLLVSVIGNAAYYWQGNEVLRWASALAGTVAAWWLLLRVARVYPALVATVRQAPWQLLAVSVVAATLCQWLVGYGVRSSLQALASPQTGWALGSSSSWTSELLHYGASSSIILLAGLVVLRRRQPAVAS